MIKNPGRISQYTCFKEKEESGSSLASANIFSNNISKKTKRGLNTKRISTASSEKMGGLRNAYCIINIKLAKRLDLNYSHHQKEMIIMCHDKGANQPYSGNHVTIDD